MESKIFQLTVLVAFVVVFSFGSNVSSLDIPARYNMSEYWLMPALYQYESIEDCLRPARKPSDPIQSGAPQRLFCVVKSVVKPDERSQKWRLIQQYSRHAFQYHHDVLTRGICLDRCKEEIEMLTSKQQQLYLQPKFNISHRYIINDWLLPNIHQYRAQYGNLVNMCLNKRSIDLHNLSVYSEIEHCTDSLSPNRPNDTLDIVFYSVLLVLVTLTVASTVYDSRLAKENVLNHYRTPLRDKGSTLLTAFSMRRNLNRLTIKLTQDPLQEDLRFLDGVRVWILAAITLSHVVIGLGMTTTQRPDILERLLSRPGFQIFGTIIPYQVDVFLTLSGLLLAVQFQKFIESKSFNWKPFWMAIFNRYLRSIPVYALLMLYTVSIYDRVQQSPSAYRIMPMERTICREKWWGNMLLINNYYRPEEQCLIHTWYLAADFQLFIVGLTVLMFLWKFPKQILKASIVLITLGASLPILNMYYNEVDAMMLLTNKGNAFQLWYDRWFVKTYQSSEGHCIFYFGGMIAGFIYNKMQKDDLLLAKSKIYKLLQVIILPLAVMFSLPAPIFHYYDFSKPSLWMSIYGGLHRLVLATMDGLGLVLMTCAEKDSFFGRVRSSKFFENAFYRVLGRLSFGFYLVHMSILKTVYGNHQEAMRASTGMILMIFCGVTLASYIVSLLAYLMVEKPCDIIFKQLFGGAKRRADTISGDLRAPPGVVNQTAEMPQPAALETSLNDDKRLQRMGERVTSTLTIAMPTPIMQTTRSRM
ncbi:O-acyltransferase like protein-like [Uranotaenia lowii]|uniref:O-acyltransferase like protein-like n=1 Tax=Uranotaenia lowii TaxID=190385 RepID=UPI00247A4B7C|nr:O-acyltransferase like protein-like [Uranotaenia lowii]